ncbi:MAG: hypothetical protein DMG74_03005 [Acidobacteria bacterium]|nr:MAG: hypothetical protein DMG74_03005 [Acidobacteriota bacterium]
MKILILGRGKTGNLVAEVARQRGHRVQVAGSSDNLNGSALTPSNLRDVEVVLDFTTPAAVIENIKASVRAGKNMGICFSKSPGLQRRLQLTAITDRFSSAITRIRRMLPPARRWRSRSSCVTSAAKSWRLSRFAKETLSGCTKLCSNHLMTRSMFATTRCRDAALPKGR